MNNAASFKDIHISDLESELSSSKTSEPAIIKKATKASPSLTNNINRSSIESENIPFKLQEEVLQLKSDKRRLQETIEEQADQLREQEMLMSILQI